MFNLNNNDLLNIGELKMAVSQTSQVYLDHQVIELNVWLTAIFNSPIFNRSLLLRLNMFPNNILVNTTGIVALL
jgi:hypothetical protein